MKRFVSFIFAILIITASVSMAGNASDAIPMSVDISNMLTGKLDLPSNTWVVNDLLRAYLSVSLIQDFTLDAHSNYTMFDLAFLDTSYMFESDGMVIALFKGTNALDGYSVMIMYAPADQDGAYGIFSDEEASFDLLVMAAEQEYGTAYINDVEKIDSIIASMDDALADAAGKETNTEDPDIPKVGTKFSCGLLKVRERDQWGFINKKKEMAIPAQWDYVSDFDHGFAHVFVGELNFRGNPATGKHGVINTSGEYIIPLMECQYIDTYTGPSEFTISYKIGDNDWKFEFWKNDGTKISNLRWEDCYDGYQDGLKCVERNGKWGYINQDGEIVIDEQYDTALPFSDGIACVGIKDKSLRLKYFYINTKGETVIDYGGWDLANAFEDGIDWTTVFTGYTLYDGEIEGEGLYAIINRNGEVITDYLWESVSIINNDLFAVSTKTDDKIKWGIINNQGEFIVEPKWDYISACEDGNAIVFLGTTDEYGSPEEGKYGLMNRDGELMLECIYPSINELESDGYYAYAEKDSSGKLKYGIVSSSGEIIKKPEYEQCPSWFNAEGLTVVETAGKYGYMNGQGEMVIEAIWDQAEPFSEGLAVVWRGEKWEVINEEGNAI